MQGKGSRVFLPLLLLVAYYAAVSFAVRDRVPDAKRLGPTAKAVVFGAAN